jgi:ubiquinone/menaquinone biosynthesis C-methylase UbiE
VPALTTPEAKRFYDRFGARQDKQDCYEAPAIEFLLAHGDFDHARSVFELGCGTGRLARTLLLNLLPPTATYRAVDISSTMVALARDRLAQFSGRAEVSIYSGEGNLPAASQSADRFLATYVFDLLSEQELLRMLGEAQRILQPGGLLCVAGITTGTTVLSRMVMGLWRIVFTFAPSLVGGCRPTRLREYLSDDRWQLKHRRVVVAYGIASEILIASRRQ